MAESLHTFSKQGREIVVLHPCLPQDNPELRALALLVLFVPHQGKKADFTSVVGGGTWAQLWWVVIYLMYGWYII
jgi:hypothetical protein